TSTPCYNRMVRIGLILGIAYVAAVFSSREWRGVVRHTLFQTPWREIARRVFEAFPSSRWRGAARIVGVPFAAYFAALVVALMFLFLLGLEIVYSPKAVYCSFVNLSRRAPTRPPNGTPP